MITGLEIYYYKICRRKLWLYARQLRMEQENEEVKIGSVIDSTSYVNEEKGIRINNEINIDFFPKENVIHEIKKSNKIESASIFQLKYYLYYLEKHGVKIECGKIDYPLLRRTVIVYLEDEDRLELEKAMNEILSIEASSVAPELKKMKICSKCAYHDYCYI